jgi:hypothetical protein
MFVADPDRHGQAPLTGRRRSIAGTQSETGPEAWAHATVVSHGEITAQFLPS